MQEGDGMIEIRLGLLGAGDGKDNRAQRMVCMLMGLASRSTRTATKQDDHQSGAEVKENRTNCMLH
jgi:hypothetical protein